MDLQQQLRQVSDDERYKILKSHIKSEIGQVVGTIPTDEQSFFNLGMDSLMSIQLANRFTASLGISLPPTLTLEYSTVDTLISFLVETFNQSDLTSDELPCTLVQSVDKYRDYPASYLHRLYYPWYLAHLERGEGRYMHISHPFHIRSNIDSSAVKQAFQLITNRHDALRSNFVMDGTTLIHRIHEKKMAEFKTIDATSWTHDALNKRIHRESQQSFDLAHDPIFRVRMFQVGPEEHVLLLTMHHMVMDGLSVVIILDEFKTIYAALKNNKFPSLLPTHSLVDYTLWQNEMLTGPAAQKLVTYWQKQLVGSVPPSLNLPTDYPYPTVYSHKGSVYSFQLEADLTEHLITFSKDERITLYTLCLAAFHLLLHHLTQQKVIIVGSFTSNRVQSQFLNTVGCLADEIFIRVDFSNNSPIKDYLHEMKINVLEALKHQGYPWLIQRQQLINKGYSMPTMTSPVYFALHNLEQGNEYPNRWGDLIVQEYELSRIEILDEVWDDLSLDINVKNGHLFGDLRYNRALFKPSTIIAFIDNYQKLLSLMIRYQDKRILDILGEINGP
jgi:acyl carrier protein